MQMQIARLNVPLIQVPDRQVVALRLVSPLSARAGGRVDSSSSQALERLPMLDWPADLFEDEKLDQ